MMRRSGSGEAQQSLLRIVRDVRRRWRLKLLLRGFAITGGAALAVFVLSSWLLQRAGFTPGALLTVRLLAYGAVLVLAWRYLLRPLLRRVSDEQAALYLEEHEPGLHELVLSALELERTGTLDPLARRTVERALERCHALEDGRVLERTELRRFGSAAGAVAVLALFLGALQPALLRQGAGALLNPLRDARAASPYSIEVLPGDVTIPRGADQSVRALLRGFEASDAELVVRSGPDSTFQRIPMFSAADSGAYDVLLFDVAQPLEYFVEAGGVRSAVYRIEVADLPYVEALALEYRYPSYTGLAPERVEDGGDVAALRGTMVHVEATTTVPAAGGAIVLSTGARVPLEQDAEGRWRGAFRVEQQGFYHIELTATSGESVTGSPEFTIDVLADRAPGIRFSKPGRDTRPTVIDEVFLEAQAEDDYGIRSIELFYSVNGGAEQRIEMYRGGQALTEVTAGHTLYLEELELEPGDVVSYYARARDHGEGPPVSSDIYFLTMRPFSREYRQAESGQQPGGGQQQGEDPGELTQQQREIIAATFNLLRDSTQYTASSYREYLNTITLMQERLREQVNTLAQRMRNRQVTADTNFARIAAILPQAAAVMDTALAQLRGGGARPALPPEQRALQQLERAEAVYREVQVQLQQGGGGGGGGSSNAEDLADLFELELDKLRNQYETVQRGEREQGQQQVDATLEKLRELARRLQQENERQRRQALQGQQGGSGGGSQRQMAEELEQAARQLQRLSREQPQPEVERAARELEQAAAAMRRSAAESRSGSTAQSQQALERLREATRRLENERGSGMERDTREALRRAERLAEQQRATSERMERAAAGGSAQELQELIERRTQQLAETGLLEQQLDALAAGTRREQRDASRRLQQSADAIRQSNLKEMQSFSRNLLRDRASPEMVRQFGARIEQAMDSVLGELRGAAEAFRRTDEQRSAAGVERAGELSRAIESMKERTANTRQTNTERTNTGQTNTGQTNTGQTNTERTNPSRTGGRGGVLTAEQVRQLRGEARERRGEAEALRGMLREQGVDASDLEGVLAQLRRLEGEAAYADAEQLAAIQAAAAEQMKLFEFALRRAVLGADRERLHLSGGDQVPEAFRALVEEYYRRLSGGRR